MFRKENTNDRLPEKLEGAPYESQEGLSPLAIGYAWVVRISTFCLEFAALAVLGRWLDARFGISPWGLICGCVIGVYAFITGLWSAVKRLDASETHEKGDD